MASSSFSASSSSSSSDLPSSARRRKYDVFLSFRGVDTRRNFLDHLYTALHQKGIYTFKDDQRLERGKPIAPELLTAIEESRFAIVIFSKNYASSSWCLDELVKIIHCKNAIGQIVLPVFYDVDPSHVRRQQGPYGEALAKHDEPQIKVQLWRKALTEAGNLAGFDLNNWHEAECIQKIVETIFLKLRHINSNVDEKQVGIVPRMENVKSLLEIESGGVRFIGILGMGGIGKSTIARAVFDEVSNHFDGISFVEHIREVSQKDGLKKVQEKLLSDVLMQPELTVGSDHEGKQMIQNRLCGKKILVVLDDVDQVSQLEATAGAPNWFGEGTRIIITTRDEHVLVAHKVKEISRVKLLDHEEAVQLFCRYAFETNIPAKGYEELSLQAIRYADGLPLALKVLGSFLCGRGMTEWRSALNRLKEYPEKKIFEILKISFDGLEKIEREIFLDIACFFRGKHKDGVVRMLDACGFYPGIGIRILQDRCLITILEYGKVEMHDLILDMGRNIIRVENPNEPGRHSRLWRPEEVSDVLIKFKLAIKTHFHKNVTGF